MFKIVYQVQVKDNINGGGGEWQAFNAGNKYNICETREEAENLLQKAKTFNSDFLKRCYPKENTSRFEYRIVKITYTIEYFEE